LPLFSVRKAADVEHLATDVAHILPLLPKNATYYWTQASVARALPAKKLKTRAKQSGLQGNAFSSVSEAYATAMLRVPKDGTLFIGGSSFVVADFLSNLQ